MAVGDHVITGFADDSFVTIEPGGDGITKQIGCDGEIARSISPDETYKVKLSLLQTSDSNPYLKNRYYLDRRTGEGMFPLLIKDLRGSMLFESEAAWVMKDSTMVRGKATNNREWEIDTGVGALDEN